MKTKRSGPGWREAFSPFSWPFLDADDETSPPREAGDEEGAEAVWTRSGPAGMPAPRPQYWSTSILNKYKLNAW